MISIPALMQPYPNIWDLKHVANDNPQSMTNAQHIDYLWSTLLKGFDNGNA